MKHLEKPVELVFALTGVFLILLSVYVAAASFMSANLDFHTDIARDFLLFEDLVYGKHITLIGARAGGISGVFHGPLWLYLNLPAFILGRGNPVVVGWFWCALFVLGIAIYFIVGKMLFRDTSKAIAVAALFASTHAQSVSALFNPFGAVLLYPLFLYHAVRFEQTKKIQHIVWAVLAIGFAIQFQMAFAVPILILYGVKIIYHAFRERKIAYLFPFFLVLIPLSTFIVFDIRHHFLQTRSVVEYLVHGGGSEDLKHLTLMSLLKIRSIQAFTEVGGVYTRFQNIATVTLIVLIVWSRKTIKQEYIPIWNELIYYYFGYWLITLPYHGVVWGYYYWPLIGSLAIAIVLMLQSVPYRSSWAIQCVLYLSLGVQLVSHLHSSSLLRGNQEGWRLYSHTATRAFKDAPREFGYYVYSNDQYGYSMKYAIHYALRQDTSKRGYSFQKKAVTYLFIDDPGTHKYTNYRDWKKNDVKITSSPIARMTTAPHFWVETYQLTPEDQAVASNPLLIQDLLFR